MSVDLNKLPVPDLIEELDFEAILGQLISLVQSSPKLADWQPLESDPWTFILEAFAYREMLLRARVNHAARSVLLTEASGADLDHVAAFYGVERLDGAYPQANVEVTLTGVQSSAVILPKDTRFTDGRGNFAYLHEDLVIEAGETTGTAMMILEVAVETSAVRTTILASPHPLVDSLNQLADFVGGSTVETDDELRMRVLLSLEKTTTAGSVRGYEYHAYTADERVEDVKVLSPAPGEVQVVAYSPVEAEIVRQNVEAALSATDVRPLTDQLTVLAGTELAVDVTATLKLEVAADSAEVQTNADLKLLEGFVKNGKLGKDVPRSLIANWLFVDGVRSVELLSPAVDVAVSDTQVAVAGNISLSTEEYEDQ